MFSYVLTFRICCLSNFPIFHMAVLTVVPRLYVTLPRPVALTTGSLYLSPSSSNPLAPAHTSGKYRSFSMSSRFFKITRVTHSVCLWYSFCVYDQNSAEGTSIHLIQPYPTVRLITHVASHAEGLGLMLCQCPEIVNEFWISTPRSHFVLGPKIM